ncbi:FCD domain-containing protein [Paracoccus sp. JM45]|uniref:FCD domain-containing protein n=1 Tax=Paracoccus sp. JM45 TaxID=2283626 RepID=UPI0016016139
MAATRAADHDIAHRETLMQRSRGPESAYDYNRAAELFHYCIAELAGNSLFPEIFDLIRGLRRQAESLFQNRSARCMRVLGQQHQHIFDTIAAGNEAGADRATRPHRKFAANAIHVKP